MVIVRCEYHDPSGRKRQYVAAVEPVGYPHTAAVCGTKHYDEPGLIWLESSDNKAYDKGQRVFSGPTAVMKIRAR